jgi:acyl dehydratase
MTPVDTDGAAREASGAHPYGRYFEEFEVGAIYKHWPAKTVTEADDHLFCMITMNHHPLHTDAHYARPRRSSAETWWSATWSTRWCWA